MGISRIRVRRKGRETDTLFSLNPGRGRHAGIHSFCVPQNVATMFGDALASLTDGRTVSVMEQFQTVEGLATDNDGGSWRIQRTGRNLEVIRDSSAGEGPATTLQFLRALTDGSGADAGSLIARYRLESEGGSAIEVVAENSAQLEEGSDRTREVVNELLTQIRGALHNKDFDTETAQVWASAFRPLWQEHLAAVRVRERAEKARTVVTDHPGSESAEELTEQIRLIETLQTAIGGLLDPATSLRAFHEQSESVSAALRKCCETLGIDGVEGEIRWAEWDEVLTVLAKLEVYRRISSNAAAATESTARVAEPALKEFLRSAQAVQSHQAEVGREMDKALAALVAKLREFELREVAPPQEGRLRGWLGRKNAAASDKTPAPVATPSEPERIEAIRQAIKRVYSTMESINHSLQGVESPARDHLAQLEGIAARAAKRLQQLESEWQRLAEEHRLPIDMKLSDALALLKAYPEMIRLRERRAQAQTQISEAKERLARAKSLIAEWRALTRSQNTTTLSTEAIILSETRNILRFHRDKVRRLERVTIGQARADLRSLNQEYFDGIIADAVGRWNEAAREAKTLAVPKIEDPRLEGIFANIERLLALDHARRLVNPAVRDVTSPAVALVAIGGQLAAEERFSALAHIKDYCQEPQVVVVTTDLSLHEALLRAGCGSVIVEASSDSVSTRSETARRIDDGRISTLGRKVLALSPEALPARQINSHVPERSLLSPKARAVLDLLAPKK